MIFFKCSISNRPSSNFFADRQHLLCVLRPEGPYETLAAIGRFKNRTIRKTDVREDDLSRVSVRSTGGHSKRRSGFNQIGGTTRLY